MRKWGEPNALTHPPPTVQPRGKEVRSEEQQSASKMKTENVNETLPRSPQRIVAQRSEAFGQHEDVNEIVPRSPSSRGGSAGRDDREYRKRHAG